MTPGDVVSIWFPFSQTEQVEFKKRPVLVVAVPEAASGADQAILVAMITSNARRVARPGKYDVLIEPWSGLQLPQASVVRVNRIWTAESRDVTGQFGRVRDSTLQEVRNAVAEAFGFSAP